MNMKCTSVQLANRSEYNRRKLNRNVQRDIEPIYITKGYHGYSFTLVQNHVPTPRRKQPILTVSNINLPENINALNSGYSLRKWSNKLPRLKSANKSGTVSRYPVFDPEYAMNYDDISNILDDVDSRDNQEIAERNNNEEYEIIPDIEELIRRSDEIRQQREDDRIEKRKMRLTDDEGPPTEDKSRKRHKHKLKKTIRFSFSKPASPQTEQVIRVDVTSNISVEELRNIESSRSDIQTVDPSKNFAKVINDCGRKQLDGDFNENSLLKFDGDDEDFIIRCSQLALTQKKR